jgi:hypothetical protein
MTPYSMTLMLPSELLLRLQQVVTDSPEAGVGWRQFGLRCRWRGLKWIRKRFGEMRAIALRTARLSYELVFARH